jgi:hypothetical protein
MRKSRIEHKWSGLAQRSDLTADMLNRRQRANSRLMRRGKSRPIDQPVDADEHNSFGQPRFPQSLNLQLRVGLAAPGDPRGNCKVGIDLKQMRRCLTGLRVTSEMGEGGRETAISRRIGEVLTLGFLTRDDGLVKATKLNKGRSHSTQRSV